MQTSRKFHQDQPQILTYLFLTEMWERFGFYTAQGLLVLYMSEYFNFVDKKSFVISGLFAGLAYIAGIVGGYIADNFLGYKTTVIWGGFFLIAGYLLLAVSVDPSLFYISLATIIAGNGLLKPNISSLLGTQYETSEKRDTGFTIFYMGINIGAALSGLSGYIRDYFGWHMPFVCASIGMMIGMFVFFSSLKYTKTTQTPKSINKLLLLCFVFLCIAGLSLLFSLDKNAEWLLPSVGIILLIYMVRLVAKQSKDYRKPTLLLLNLILFSIVFWMLFYQLFISANIFVERMVEKDFYGIKLTTTIFYASEGVFVILLAPFFAWLWHTLSMINKNPSLPVKFALALVSLGCGFLLLAISTYYPNNNSLINPLWVFAAYFLITIGEMLLSPIGLAAVTILAPPNLTGFMMGIWFVAIGFGGFFAGMIATVAIVPKTITLVADKLLIYHHAFLVYAIIAFITAGLLFLLRLLLGLSSIR